MVERAIECNKCGSDTVVKQGHDWCGGVWCQRYRCKNCGHPFVMESRITEEQLEKLAKYARAGVKISEYCDDLSIHVRKREHLTRPQARKLLQCIEADKVSSPPASPNA